MTWPVCDNAAAFTRAAQLCQGPGVKPTVVKSSSRVLSSGAAEGAEAPLSPYAPTRDYLSLLLLVPPKLLLSEGGLEERAGERRPFARLLLNSTVVGVKPGYRS